MSPNLPTFGLGTFRLKGQTALDSVRTALELGYRAIDTAQIYDNEAEVGQAVAESGLPPHEVFITTKVWVTHLGADKLIPSLKASLHKLRREQVDLTLIHWPPRAGSVPVAECVGALAQARAEGLTAHIGVSNFTIELTRQALEVVGPGGLATNQVELSPYLQNRTLADYLQAQGIRVTSYMTLGVGKVLADPVIAAIAQARGATPAQVVLAWALQSGHAVIPSSTRREHLASNLKARELQLGADDMARIAALDRGERLASPESLAPAWD